MAYESQAGRARTNARNPQAHAICDRCGFRYNMVSLKWQFDWRGSQLTNTRILVCNDCLDTPQEQQRTITIPADPQPILNARPENFQDAESSTRLLAGHTTDPATGLPVPNANYRVTQTGDTRNTQITGAPVGLEQGGVMPLQNAVAYGVLLPVISLISVGSPIITATCSAPHGLSTGAQISVMGSGNPEVDGMFSITVTTATAFTYQVGPSISAGSLLRGNTRIVTANVGLPLTFSQIPETGL